MMDMIATLTGWTPPFTIGPANEYSHRYARFDNSKVIKDFNYAFYSFEDTIRHTIKWFSFIKKIKLKKVSSASLNPRLNG